jgi:hypothetical protein
MLSADCIYSMSPLDLDFGPGLGQWGDEEHIGSALLVQSGFVRSLRPIRAPSEADDGHYTRTRGIPRRVVPWDELWEATAHLDADTATGVPYSMRVFVGLGMSQIRHDPIGIWASEERSLTFSAAKRDVRLPPVDGWMEALPRDNPPELWDAAMDLALVERKRTREEDGATLLIDDQPDAGDFSGEGVG